MLAWEQQVETDVCVPDLGLSLVNKVEQSWIWTKQMMQTVFAI